MDNKNQYKKLKELLNNNTTWPLKYMFKCVAPVNSMNINHVLSILSVYGEVKFKDSEKKNYVSLTCICYMKNADEIIKITDMLSGFEDIMVL